LVAVDGTGGPKAREDRRKKAVTSMQKVLVQLLGAPDRTFPEADLPVAEPLRLQRLLLALADSSRCAGYYNREAWGEATPGLAPGRKDMPSNYKNAFKFLVECVGLRVLDGVMRLTDELHDEEDEEDEEVEEDEDEKGGGGARQGRGRKQGGGEGEARKLAHSNPPLAGSSSMHAALGNVVTKVKATASSSTSASSVSGSKARGRGRGKGGKGGRGHTGRVSRSSSGRGAVEQEQQQEQEQGQAKKAEAAHGKEKKAARQEKKKMVEKEEEEEEDEEEEEEDEEDEEEEEEEEEEEKEKEKGGGGGGGEGAEESSSTILPSLMSAATSLASAGSSASSSSSSSSYHPVKHDRFCPPTNHKLYLNGALLEFGTWLGDLGKAWCGYVQPLLLLWWCTCSYFG